MRCARRRARVPCAHQERRGRWTGLLPRGREGGRAGVPAAPRGAAGRRARACAHVDGSGRAGGRAEERASWRRVGGRKGCRAAGARPRAGARCRFRASRARAVRAPGAAGQVDRRFQPLRQKEAAQEGPASPGRGEGVENHEAGGCARAVALLRGREGGRAGAGSGRASGRACGRAGGRAGGRACGWAGRRAGGQPNVLSCAGARGRLGQRAPPESLGPALPPGRHQRSCRLARQRSIPGA